MKPSPVTHAALRNVLLSALGLLASAGPARADTSAPESYQAILQRNPFGLRPPAPVAAPASTAAETKPLPPLALTGLAALGPRRWACFNLGPAGKPARSLKLLVGQEEGDLQLVSVNLAEETAEILHAGQRLFLSLKGTAASRAITAALKDQLEMAEHTRATEAHQRRERLREQKELEATGLAIKQ